MASVRIFGTSIRKTSWKKGTKMYKNYRAVIVDTFGDQLSDPPSGWGHPCRHRHGGVVQLWFKNADCWIMVVNTYIYILCTYIYIYHCSIFGKGNSLVTFRRGHYCLVNKFTMIETLMCEAFCYKPMNVCRLPVATSIISCKVHLVEEAVSFN